MDNLESTDWMSIKQISDLSKINAHTIRAWEKRYALVTPSRSAGGTRRYRRGDLRRLQLIKAAIEAGHRVGALSGLDDEALVARAGARRQPRRRATQGSEGATLDDATLQVVIDLATKLDARGVESELEIQSRLMGPSSFRSIYCAALMAEVGRRWAEGRLHMTAEHLLSKALTSILGRDLPPNAGGPKIVFSTPEGERHELGLLIAVGAALDAGADAINLGTSLPARALAEAATRTGARAVALSILHMDHGSQRAYAGRLLEALTPATSVWIGGGNALRDIEGCAALDLSTMRREISLLSQNP